MAISQKYQNKRIAIYGMGITGCSAARTLKKLGAKIFCWDDDTKIRTKVRNLNFSLNKIINSCLFVNSMLDLRHISPSLE